MASFDGWRHLLLVLLVLAAPAVADYIVLVMLMRAPMLTSVTDSFGNPLPPSAAMWPAAVSQTSWECCQAQSFVRLLTLQTLLVLHWCLVTGPLR